VVSTAAAAAFLADVGSRPRVFDEYGFLSRG